MPEENDPFDMSYFDKPAENRFAPWVEPSQKAQQAAQDLWHLFVALVREGFSPSQAERFIKTMLIAQSRGEA